MIEVTVIIIYHHHQSSSTSNLKKNTFIDDNTEAIIDPYLSPDQSNATIVIQLSGEMGNNLHKIAFGRGLQLIVSN